MRRALHLAVCTAFAVLAACASLPQTAPPFQQPPFNTPITKATLAVVAHDYVNPDVRIAGATVEVRDRDAQGSPVIATLTTNADGYAATEQVNGRQYDITITKVGYSPGTASEFLTGNSQIPIALMVRVPLPPPQLVEPLPWRGQLRKARDDLGFQDAAGAWQLPLCAHFGEAFSAFVHGKTVGTVGSSSALRGFDVVEQLRRIKAAGYDCIRGWAILGYYDQNRPDQSTWKAWAGREVTPFAFTAYSGRSIPATPDYYERLEQFIAAVKAAGLTLFDSRGDMVGQPASKIRQHTDQAAAIYDRVGREVLALAEACNECWQNGGFTPKELLDIVAPYKARGALTIHSTAERAEEPEDIATISNGASIYTVHGLRVGPPTQLLEHIFSLGYFQPRDHDSATGKFYVAPVQRLGIQGEPAGPGSGVSVGQVNDRELLALMAATSLMSRQWWVYMSGYGVFWDGPIDSQPGFYAVPRIRRAIVDFAPEVMSWGLYHGGLAGAALRSPTGYEGDPGNTNGPARIFNAVSPDRRRFVAVIEGGHGVKQAQNTLDCPVRLDVIGVNDDETLSRHTFTLQPRESMPFDYRVGRLLLGACQ
jgi:hypothetical protein